MSAMVAAQVKAAADAGMVDTALKELAAVVQEATEAEMLGYALDARLTAAEIERAAGRPEASAHLEGLQRDADAKGFGQISKRVAVALDS